MKMQYNILFVERDFKDCMETDCFLGRTLIKIFYYEKTISCFPIENFLLVLTSIKIFYEHLKVWFNHILHMVATRFASKIFPEVFF